ncbi:MULTISPECIES: enoyl-CoA hydratase/isomerase [unclassified Moorena]|uniref:enoyl-CoA hydratase/isomerase n=1 Tax=unclassified Moorena TaxID=2683338 RepID=UPI0014010AD3|nr:MULTISPECIES: enoyl-CoA hydratase/isomerase [unclassified Moorena]NEO13000.1 enoyl-CoA hydratase/isomerase [Moorena sp. SIO3E8]NEQ02026.1 enoyl-CoA hydratase/isomerase [Moorena sp. SIO3F7]
MGIAMNYQTLKVSYQDVVQRIQIYRPEANNSINSQLTMELLSAFQAAEAEEVVKVVILEGLPDVFCTGMDFEEVATGKQLDPKASNHGYYNILKQMSQSSKVILSFVRGKVQAGGVGLVAASDLVIADETATFVLSELLFGLLPACVLPFLIRRVGFQKAYRLALTTQAISASEADKWGLIDEYGSNTNQLISKYIRRLKYLPSSGVKELKNYINQLWIIQSETQDLAVNKISSLIAEPTVQEKIQRFQKEGLFPWQT